MTEQAVTTQKGTAARCKTNRSSQGVLVIWCVCISIMSLARCSTIKVQKFHVPAFIIMSVHNCQDISSISWCLKALLTRSYFTPNLHKSLTFLYLFYIHHKHNKLNTSVQEGSWKPVRLGFLVSSQETVPCRQACRFSVTLSSKILKSHMRFRVLAKSEATVYCTWMTTG